MCDIILINIKFIETHSLFFVLFCFEDDTKISKIRVNHNGREWGQLLEDLKAEMWIL